jgi:hypothetical protein
MNRALVSLAVVASLLTTGCATTSNGTAMASVNTAGLDRDEFGLAQRDERMARTAVQTEHHIEVGGNGSRR